MADLMPPDERRSRRCVDVLVAAGSAFTRQEFTAAIYALGDAIRSGALGTEAWETWIQLMRAGESQRKENEL